MVPSTIIDNHTDARLVGAEVTLRAGRREMAGRIVEDRGPIGVDGTRIVRIEVQPRGANEPLLFEVPVTALVFSSS